MKWVHLAPERGKLRSGELLILTRHLFARVHHVGDRHNQRIGDHKHHELLEEQVGPGVQERGWRPAVPWVEHGQSLAQGRGEDPGLQRMAALLQRAV